MTARLMQAIASRDGATLVHIAGRVPAHSCSNAGVVNCEAARLVDSLFRQLKQVFPAAAATNLRTEADEAAAKKQWIAAFAENGIRSREQLSAGMRFARANQSPFWPSPGQFVAWCKNGRAVAAGLPDEEALYDMVMRYCRDRGLYASPEEYPWESNAVYWMVTGLYSQMRSLNLTESELRAKCSKELAIMTRRIEAGEEIQPPRRQIPQLHIPLSNEKGLDKIAELRKRHGLVRRRA